MAISGATVMTLRCKAERSNIMYNVTIIDGDIVTHYTCCNICNNSNRIWGQRFVYKLCPIRIFVPSALLGIKSGREASAVIDMSSFKFLVESIDL